MAEGYMSLIVTCSSDLTLKIWDTQNEYKNTKTFYGHDHSVSCARFMPGGDFIVSASRDRTIRVWEVANGSVPTPLSLWIFSSFCEQILRENLPRPFRLGAVGAPF